MYTDFIEKFNATFTSGNPLILECPRVDLREMIISTSIHIVGSEVPVYYIKYSPVDKVYEVSNSFKTEVTAFATKDPAEIIELIKSDMESTGLGEVMKELGELINKLYI